MEEQARSKLLRPKPPAPKRSAPCLDFQPNPSIEPSGCLCLSLLEVQVPRELPTSILLQFINPPTLRERRSPRTANADLGELRGVGHWALTN